MNKILVVEDENDLRNNLFEIFSSEQFSVLTAKDGQEGLELAKREYPDIILSDVTMPVMNGFEMLKCLQNDPHTSSIPVIFLTAKTKLNEMREGMNIGADDYLMKPFRIDEVLNAVNLRIKKNNSQLEKIRDVKINLLRKIPHELRTPLVSILGFSEMIEEDFDQLTKEELKTMIHRIKVSGTRLHGRIEKFLTYTELMALDKKEIILPLEEYEIDENYLSAKINRLVSNFNRTSDVKAVFEPAWIQISERYFLILLNELTENSLKFSQKGQSVIISGFVSGKIYKIEITDRGNGFPSDAIDEIDAFHQFGDDKENTQGNGLGLAISKKIVELFDGYLKIESKENHFTKVEFGIPLK